MEEWMGMDEMRRLRVDDVLGCFVWRYEVGDFQ